MKYIESVTEYIRTRVSNNDDRNNLLRFRVYAYADDFTYSLLKYLLKFNFDDILYVFDQHFSNTKYLLGKIKELNEQNDMYTEDKPNFAIQIALILHSKKYKKIFTTEDEDEQQNKIAVILSGFEQFGFTGIYGYKDSRKRNDSIDLYLYYPEVLSVMIKEGYPSLDSGTILHKITNVFTHDFISDKKKFNPDIAKKSTELLQTKNPNFFHGVFISTSVADMHKAVNSRIKEVRKDRRYNPYATARGKSKTNHKKPKKKKLETKKKIDFKKLRKHITQRLKPRSKFRRSKTISKARNKK